MPNESVLNIELPAQRNLSIAIIAGFVYSSGVILYSIAPGVGSNYPLSSLVLILFGALVAWLFRREQLNWRYWASFLASTACGMASMLAYGRALTLTNSILQFQLNFEGIADVVPISFLGVLLLFSIFAMVFVYRAHPLLYAPLPVLVGIELQLLGDSFLLAFAASAALLLAFLLSNYVVMLIQDHRRDARSILRWTSETNSKKLVLSIIKDSLLSLSAVFVLVILGWNLHEYLSNQVKAALYETGILQLSPDQSEKIAERRIRDDVLATVDFEAEALLDKYHVALNRVAADGQVAADSVPSLLREIFATYKPGVLPNGKCETFHVKVRFTGGIGFRNQCRGLVGDFNGYIQSTYQRSTSRFSESANTAARDASSDLKISSVEALKRGGSIIRAVAGDVRLAVLRVFWVLDALYVIGYILLVNAIIGAFVIAASRRIFSAENGLRFNLARSTGASALEVTVHSAEFSSQAELDNALCGRPLPLEFCDYPVDLKAPHIWHLCAVGASLAPSGYGFENIEIPQPGSCSIQRLFAGRLSMVRVNVEKAIQKKSEGQNGAQVNVGPDEEILVIRVSAPQEVIFRVNSLVGFSEGVKLQSVYSTHVGLYLLGLGSFHTYASGNGYLALRRKRGRVRANSTKDAAIFNTDWLAFDRRAKFGVLHQHGPIGYWMSLSQLTIRSKPGTVLLAGGQIDVPGFWRRLRGLLRYVLLPF